MSTSSSLAAHRELRLRIRENLQTVRVAIEAAARRAGRDARAIRLVAVSKTQSPEAVAAAAEAGQTDFGENIVQEALPKIEQLSPYRLNWHFIGSLQTNKAKFIPGHFVCLHSLDRLPLAQKLADACTRAGTGIDALLQVNVSREPTKHGVSPEDLYALVEQILVARFASVRLRGLMTIAPYEAREAVLRECFARLRSLRDGCTERFGLADFTELSMGMSADFEAAIAEGATLVRIGTAIFGPRPTP